MGSVFGGKDVQYLLDTLHGKILKSYIGPFGVLRFDGFHIDGETFDDSIGRWNTLYYRF